MQETPQKQEPAQAQKGNTPQYQDDEIDLRKLFQAIGNFFAGLWIGFIRIIVSIRRVTIEHKYLFLILIILGVVGAIVFSKTSRPYYRTSMLLQISIYRGKLIEKSIEKLDMLCKEEDRSELASVLGIDSLLAVQIKGFEAIPFVNEQEIIDLEILKIQLKNLKANEEQISQVISRLEIDNKSTYEIVVRVYDNSIIPDFEEPVVNYFRNIKYISKRLEINKQNRESKLRKLQLEAEKMDSLKSVIYRNLATLSNRTREGSVNVILAEDNITNPLSVIREDMRLYDEELAIRRLLALEPEFEVVDSFATFLTLDSPRVTKSTVYSILIAIGLGYFMILIRGINAYLSRVEKESA